MGNERKINICLFMRIVLKKFNFSGFRRNRLIRDIRETSKFIFNQSRSDKPINTNLCSIGIGCEHRIVVIERSDSHQHGRGTSFGRISQRIITGGDHQEVHKVLSWQKLVVDRSGGGLDGVSGNRELLRRVISTLNAVTSASWVRSAVGIATNKGGNHCACNGDPNRISTSLPHVYGVTSRYEWSVQEKFEATCTQYHISHQHFKLMWM